MLLFLLRNFFKDIESVSVYSTPGQSYQIGLLLFIQMRLLRLVCVCIHIYYRSILSITLLLVDVIGIYVSLLLLYVKTTFFMRF